MDVLRRLLSRFEPDLQPAVAAMALVIGTTAALVVNAALV
jgi:hypothetical protein